MLIGGRIDGSACGIRTVERGGVARCCSLGASRQGAGPPSGDGAVAGGRRAECDGAVDCRTARRPQRAGAGRGRSGARCDCRLPHPRHPRPGRTRVWGALQPWRHAPGVARDRLRLADAATAPPQGRRRGPRRVQKKLPQMVEDIAREHPGQPIELWFQDEMRVGQKGTLTRVWAAKGERATAPRDLRFGYASLFGAVCPVRDTGAAIVMPMVNTIAMNEHLIEIGRCVSPGAHAVLILDGAGWHPREGLAVPANITLLFLPTYSPELNPVEELWHELRRRFLANRVIDTLEDLIEACCNAWNAALHQPGFIKSVTGFSWLPALTTL